jgi:ribosomal protein L31E
MTHEHIIHLNNVVRIPNTRKANRAIFAIKQYAQKHTHAGMKNIHVSNDVNELVWAQGKNHKINKLKVVLRKKDDMAFVFTPEGKDLKAFDKPTKETTPKKSEKKDATEGKAASKDSEKTEKAVEKAVKSTKMEAKKENTKKAEKKDKAE